MKTKALISLVMFTGALVWGQTDPLGVPGFHHLHLNSTNPEAAIDFYTRQFPSTSKITFAGAPALKSPNNVLVLFTRVNRPPALQPQTAIWHFGWHVTDVRKNMETYKGRPEVKLMPLYTTDEGGSVLVSSDTWPGTGGILGLTKAQIADAKAKGVKPLGSAADCKVPRGPDRSWPALEKQGMFRTPTTGVLFGDVAMNWYMRQSDKPLAPTRGHLMDHVGLSVADLDAWVAKLRSEGVRFLQEPYRLGDTRGVMIEGPSHEAIELVEVK